MQARPASSVRGAVTETPHQRRPSRARCGVYDCSACDLYAGAQLRRPEKARRPRPALCGDGVPGRAGCPGCSSGNLQLLRAQQPPCPVFVCARKLRVAGCHECTEPTCRLDEALPRGRQWVSDRCPLRLKFGGEATVAGFRGELRLARGVAAAPGELRSLPLRPAGRMRRYLQLVADYADRGVPAVSSHHLARAVGVRASLVRRDLAKLGHAGKRGGGYQVGGLHEAIRRRLRVGQERGAIWLGAASLQGHRDVAKVLARLQCRLVAVFDSSPRWVGAEVAGLPVQPATEVVKGIRRHRATLAIVADRELAREGLIESLVRAGVTAILNLTEAPVRASAGAVVEQADLGSQVLRLLSRLHTTLP